MEFNNIIEKRTVDNGQHSLVLEMSKNEFDKVMTGDIEDIAFELVDRHLLNRGDDGIPSDVKLDYDKNKDIVKIHANVEYLGNDHTDY